MGYCGLWPDDDGPTKEQIAQEAREELAAKAAQEEAHAAVVRRNQERAQAALGVFSLVPVVAALRGAVVATEIHERIQGVREILLEMMRKPDSPVWANMESQLARAETCAQAIRAVTNDAPPDLQVKPFEVRYRKGAPYHYPIPATWRKP